MLPLADIEKRAPFMGVFISNGRHQRHVLGIRWMPLVEALENITPFNHMIYIFFPI